MFLLDTNVVSELRNIRVDRADPNVAHWADSVDAVDLYVSAITVFELTISVLRAERLDAVQGAAVRAWVDGQVLPAFAGRILSVGVAVAERSALLHLPGPRPICDGLIAAQALMHRMIVVTRNVADFAPKGVATVNPRVAPKLSTSCAA